MDLLISDVFRSAARAVPTRTAAAFGDASFTFGELDRRGNQTARALVAAHGDRVLVWSATSLDVLPLFVALAKVGAVFAPMNPGLSIEEATETAAAARPTIVLADRGRAEAAGAVAAKVGARHITVDDLTARAAAEDDGDVTALDLSERDTHVLFFTSGSTGRPKGVVLSHRTNYLRTHPGGLFEPKGPMVCPFPLFHMAGWTIALQQWQGRGTVIFVEPADGPTICAAVERHRATRLYCIPAVWRRVLDHLEHQHYDLSSVRSADTGTSATPPELLEAVQAAFPGASVRVFYGSTEAAGVAALEPADAARKPGSCGLPSPLAEVRIDDTGELWVRGPLLFDGYFEDDEATAEALVDGWYRTGDLAEADAEGYLTIVGRARDVIRTGGETVAPAEVEAVLATHPAVADVAVVGVPDAQWGEVVCAVVVAAGDGAPELEELRAHCAAQLAAHKRPRRVAVVGAIPRTAPTGQVQRRLLVERLS